MASWIFFRKERGMSTSSNLRRIELMDILADLPDIDALDVPDDVAGGRDDLFLAALGFEDRCPWIAELLADCREYRAARATYFEYATNQSDNEMNRPRLLKAMEAFASQVRPMQCDSDEFVLQLRGLLSEVCAQSEVPQVMLDVSVCSSKLLITTLTVLYEFDIKLRIVYSEASVYHPTEEEYRADPQRWTSDARLGLSRGVSAVTRSPDHPGSRRDVLPEAVIVFPTFKPERIRAILADVDPWLLMRPEDRVVWMIGEPHLLADHWRMDVQRKINEIPARAPIHNVSTFDYKKTLETLERAFRPFDCRYLVNIAPLGSKMQAVGVVLFWYVRPEVAIYFASPVEYNAVQYSEGCKAIWKINLGALANMRRKLDTVGTLVIDK
jgi:hypothetical protein